MSAWRFKKGRREEAFDLLDRKIADDARALKGYRGSLDLFALDDPDAAVIITLWEDEEALNASRRGIFQTASSELEEFIAAPPDVRNYRADVEIRI
ncbi:MAG: hypothetical protein QMD46_09240 [Methanomicrobiales archaeon]|nr:hypothetical protein [Methanomicrobiales archaeon]